MLNYFRNSVWQFGRKVQNHRDSGDNRPNAFCAVWSSLLLHLVEMPFSSLKDTSSEMYRNRSIDSIGIAIIPVHANCIRS